jgi:hypothetical protein
VTFDLQSCHFQLSARGAIHFPPGSAGNLLRGALGSKFREIACTQCCPGRGGKNVRQCEQRTTCAYARIFEPATTVPGPSGLSDLPRPFVIRAAALDGRTVGPGEQFCFSLNLFSQIADDLTRAVAQWSDIVSIEQSRVSIDLAAPRQDISHIRVVFQTPTELKTAAGEASKEFSVLLARARDRVSTLRSLYGRGPLEIDFRGMAERARAVRMVCCHLRRVAVERRSSRTGQRHGIGGFVGYAEYAGPLTEFVPYLEAASWTGVGRHCTWGNGHITAEILG